MNRLCDLRVVCGFLALFLGHFTSPARSADTPSPPNVIFLRTDDQARWAVGINGNKDIRTPNMDRLHREGASFANAFVTTPVCSPSRVAMLTGLHGVQAGITEYIRPKETFGIKPEYITWTEVFHQAGYLTAHIGKWHVGNTPEFHPTRHGFDHFMGFIVGGTQPIGPELEIDGVVKKLPGVCLNDFLIDDAMRFIREKQSKPFLVQVDFRSPHTPYEPETPEDTALYADANLAIPDVPGIDRQECLRLTRQYYSAISSVDRNIGRLLALLDELNLAKNTIIVFTSDHGYMLGHHGLWHKGNAVFFPTEGAPEKERKSGGKRRPNMFDDSLRVPLAIRWPAKIKPGTVVQEPVMHIDFYPSLIHLAGLLMPELPPIQPVQGRDFSPLLAGGSVPPRPELYFDYNMKEGKESQMRAVCTSDWKLVKHYAEADSADELFDLKKDPGETQNLFSNPPDPSVLDSLERKLIDWQKKIGDPLLASEEFKKRESKYLR